MDYLLLFGGIGVLIGCYVFYTRQREARITSMIDHTSDPLMASEILDEAIAEDKATTDFWKRQNPGGGL